MHILVQIVKFLIATQLSFGAAPARKMSAAEQAEASRKLTRAGMDFIVKQSAIVTNAKDFDRHLLMWMKPSDRKAIGAELRRIKKFPTFQRVGDSLIVESGKDRFEIKRAAVAKQVYLVNGRKWTYDPAKPFLPQYAKLEKEIQKTRQSAGLIDLLLPQADAMFFVPVLMLIVGAVVAVVGQDVIAEGWCWGVDQAGGSTQKCDDIKLRKDEALYGTAPLLDAVSNQAGSDNTNVLNDYEARDWVCPTNTDGQPREYRGMIRKVQVEGGGTEAGSPWYQTVIKFSPQGYPTAITITKSDANPATIDLSKPEEAANLVVHMDFNPETKKPVSYTVPNPDFKAGDLMGKPTVKLALNQNLTPAQTDVINSGHDLIKFLNYRNYNCVAEQALSNQAAGIETPSPELVPAAVQ